MTPRGRTVAGAVTLVLCAQYLMAEFVAAAAWTPAYSYSRDYVSDLGVTACAATGPCSPLAFVMNTGFVLSGVLAILAATLLTPLIPPGAARRLVVGLAWVHGVGSVIVGLVHSAPGSAAGTPPAHLYGAYAAILGGNLALIAAGFALASAWVAPPFRVFSVATGLFGLACGLTLVATRGWPPGLLERGAVDTITAWEVVSGLLLAIKLRRSGFGGDGQIAGLGRATPPTTA